MKAWILLILVLIFVNATAKAESYSCLSANKKWQASFSLEGDKIFDLVILKHELVKAEYSELSGSSYQIGQTRYYEFSLGGAKYFDFDRRVYQKNFEVNFLLTHNPFRPEIWVSCSAI